MLSVRSKLLDTNPSHTKLWKLRDSTSGLSKGVIDLFYLFI